MSAIEQSFEVPFRFAIQFTRDLFAPENRTLVVALTRVEAGKRHKVLFVIDENVAKATPGLERRIQDYCERWSLSIQLLGEPVRVLGGEATKNDIAHVLGLVERVNALGIDRQSFVAVIGGGAVLDMACFAAAIAHRGIRVVRIPTTVLSQNDSGVGVKNGINLFGKKNFLGTFAPPFAVINDSLFLDTLEPRDKISGIAEAVKVALIKDREFFEYLELNAEALHRADPEVMSHQIRRSAELHSRHIGTNGDPFEVGSARPLDYGHWAAHKLESLTRHRLRHGEAVSIGLAIDTLYSVYAGFLPAAQGERILRTLETIGLPIWDEAVLARVQQGPLALLAGLREFQEHLGGELHVTMLREIGAGFEVNEIDERPVLRAIETLEARASRTRGEMTRPAASF
jgi:3-dehydroquinate synthase